ncbi:hypothetical protein BBJ28_00013184 [Nothophytophthora sp. Chile5]|nr:hypothetical protein BBJ28_00013184 [Nothophytophthora sp. Chile5]
MASKTFVLDEQGEADLLREALQTARDQGFRMQRAVDAGDQPAVLKHAAEVLRELRTSLLSPKNYYQLYMQVLDELRHLESYAEEQQQAGAPMRALYEQVQSSGNVLPRLYLLVTVGAVYIQSLEAPAREVLTDLVEMTKGVQHPLRGLFLRHYLSLCVRDKLPDSGSVYEKAGGGSVSDAVSFLLQNLRETNMLWIRLQHQKATGSKPRSVREKERLELRLLVGTSLVRLSQMEGVTRRVYTDQVLPSLLKDVVLSCQDRMAQQYLLDCVVQVFPDAFHLATLESLLAAMTHFQPDVDVALLLTALVTRLTTYRETEPLETEFEPLPVFQLVLDAASKLLLKPEGGREAQVASVLPFFVAFTNFTLTWLAGQSSAKTTALDQVVAACLAFLRDRTAWRVDKDKTTKQLVVTQLQTLALALFRALSLPELQRIPALRELLTLLPWHGAQKDVALSWLRILLSRHERVIRNEAQMTFVLQLLAPLVRDDPSDLQTPAALEPGNAKTEESFEAEQQTLAKVVHLVATSEDLDETFRVFSVARRAFGQGGVFRIRFTLVPLIYQALALARALATPQKNQSDAEKPTTWATTPREVLQFVHEMVTALASKQDALSVPCVHLFLQCALVADGCELEAVAYEFTTQAFIVYEDQITLAREQWRALELMVAALRATRHLSSANYEVLAAKTTQYAARLLKKNDQAAMVLHCAHLFWHPSHQDGKRVLECLQRSLRIADALSDSTASHVPLFLEILEATPEVTRKYLAGLLALVKDHLDNMEHGQMRRDGESRYRAIVRHMDALELSADALSPR